MLGQLLDPLRSETSVVGVARLAHGSGNNRRHLRVDRGAHMLLDHRRRPGVERNIAHECLRQVGDDGLRQAKRQFFQQLIELT